MEVWRTRGDKLTLEGLLRGEELSSVASVLAIHPTRSLSLLVLSFSKRPGAPKGCCITILFAGMLLLVATLLAGFTSSCDPQILHVCSQERPGYSNVLACLKTQIAVQCTRIQCTHMQKTNCVTIRFRQGIFLDSNISNTLPFTLAKESRIYMVFSALSCLWI